MNLDDPRVSAKKIGYKRAKNWRLIFILWLELAVLAGILGLLIHFNVINSLWLGYWCLGATLVFGALSLKAYLAD